MALTALRQSVASGHPDGLRSDHSWSEGFGRAFRAALQMRTSAVLVAAAVLAAEVRAQSVSDNVAIQQDGETLLIRIGERAVARYVFADNDIPRPYFAQVRTRDDVQVTRNHPPVTGVDADDHATMHPGIWMAFGDLENGDFWRNRSRIEQKGFNTEFPVIGETAEFADARRYVRHDGVVVCEERFRCTVRPVEPGFLLEFRSRFVCSEECRFGDQEEMGLGIRVATPLTEQNGGLLTSSSGSTGAGRIWGQAARWCDYSGIVGGRRHGITILCHPSNFRESWMHARDYGLLVANPFGRKSMQQGPADSVRFTAEQPLELRYAVLVWSEPASITVGTIQETVYREYATR